MQWGYDFRIGRKSAQSVVRSQSNSIIALTTADLPQDGLITEWRFDEGGGGTVYDHAGSNNIAFPVQNPPQWSSKGLSFESQLLQSPTITNMRTVAILFRQKRDETGSFLMSGGASSGNGIFGNFISSAMGVHIGCGNGVSTHVRRSNGQAGHRLNRGGWILVFVEYKQNYNSPLGLGGRHSNTTYRATEAEIGWVGIYDKTLDEAERNDIYSHVRGTFGRPRGIYLDWRDCPQQIESVLLWGQSNAGGRAALSDLTPQQREQTVPNVYISSSHIIAQSWDEPALFDLGVNQIAGTGYNVASNVFGLETGVAFQWATSRPQDNLFISKTSGSGTELATYAGGATQSAHSWNPRELPTSGGYYRALTDWWTSEQTFLSQGIGPRMRQLWWVQGENDAIDEQQSLDYRANIELLWNAFKTDTGYETGITMQVAQLANTTSLTYRSAVRAAITDFTNTTPDASLIDVDTLLNPDPSELHYDAAQQLTLGSAFYDRLIAALP